LWISATLLNVIYLCWILASYN